MPLPKFLKIKIKILSFSNKIKFSKHCPKFEKGKEQEFSQRTRHLCSWKFSNVIKTTSILNSLIIDLLAKLAITRDL